MWAHAPRSGGLCYRAPSGLVDRPGQHPYPQTRPQPSLSEQGIARKAWASRAWAFRDRGSPLTCIQARPRIEGNFCSSQRCAGGRGVEIGEPQ
jgi:hypothetical protein